VQVKRGERMVVVRETGPVNLTMNQSVWLTIESGGVNFYDEGTGYLLAREEAKPA
jgi:hypothetical protein